MKNRFKIPLGFVFLGCILAGCANAQKVALSNDERVIAELQKRVDAKRDELGKTGGSKLNARSVCIERLKETESVIVIGFFRYDQGCHFDGAFIDSKYFESTDMALSKNALAAFGWQKAPKREREMLASYWVQKGLLAFFTVLYTKDKDMGEREFHPPQAMTAENGEIKVKLWVQLPSGMRRGKEFKRVEYKFSKDGSLTGNSTLEALHDRKMKKNEYHPPIAVMAENRAIKS